MSFHRLFIAGDGLLVEGQRPIAHIYQGPQAVLINLLYFCPICGDPWARLWHEPHPSYDNSPLKWQAVEAPCRLHGGGFLIPPNWTLEFPYPLEILRHDAELYVHANNPNLPNPHTR